MIPVLQTERLVLRGHTRDDFAAVTAMWSDPIVTRYITGRASTPQEAWFRLLRYAGHWALMGYGYWALEEKSTGAVVGELGFADFMREIEPSMHGTPELGWILASRVHGQGYATEAVGAAVAWGDAHLGLPRTVCIIAPENVASIRVAEKCGYREFAQTAYNGEPTIMFERLSRS